MNRPSIIPLLCLLGLFALSTNSVWADDAQAAAIMQEISTLNAEKQANIEKMKIELTAMQEANRNVAQQSPQRQQVRDLKTKIENLHNRNISTYGGSGRTINCDGNKACERSVDAHNALVSQHNALTDQIRSSEKRYTSKSDAFKALQARNKQIANRIAVLKAKLAMTRQNSAVNRRKDCTKQCPKAATKEGAWRCMVQCLEGGASAPVRTRKDIGTDFFGVGKKRSAEEAIKEYTSKPRAGPRSFKIKPPPPPPGFN